MSASVELKGLKELEERLLLLGKVAGAKAMRQALFHGSKPILDQAKANVRSWPGGSGALYYAMGRTFTVERGGADGGTQFNMAIRPRIRNRVAVALHNIFYRRGRTGIFYGHLLEFGHRIAHRKTGRLQKRPESRGHVGAGSVPPQRFLRPALDTAGLRATYAFTNELRRRIERALKKQDPAASNA